MFGATIRYTARPPTTVAFGCGSRIWSTVPSASRRSNDGGPAAPRTRTAAFVAPEATLNVLDAFSVRADSVRCANRLRLQPRSSVGFSPQSALPCAVTEAPRTLPVRHAL